MRIKERIKRDPKLKAAYPMAVPCPPGMRRRWIRTAARYCASRQAGHHTVRRLLRDGFRFWAATERRCGRSRFRDRLFRQVAH